MEVGMKEVMAMLSVVGDEGVDKVGDEMTGGDVICCSDGSLDWEM